jgi:hypothetical protein
LQTVPQIASPGKMRSARSDEIRTMGETFDEGAFEDHDRESGCVVLENKRGRKRGTRRA